MFRLHHLVQSKTFILLQLSSFSPSQSQSHRAARRMVPVAVDMSTRRHRPVRGNGEHAGSRADRLLFLRATTGDDCDQQMSSSRTAPAGLGLLCVVASAYSAVSGARSCILSPSSFRVMNGGRSGVSSCACCGAGGRWPATSLGSAGRGPGG